MADNDLFYLTDPVRGKIPDINAVVDGQFIKVSPTRAQFIRLFGDASKYIARMLIDEVEER